MKIKRFVGTDMRQVLRLVREEQGPDAVILSNQRIEGGIEVIAAVDYDEALMQHALGSPAAAVAGDAGAAAEPAAPAPERRAVEPSPDKPPFPEILHTAIAVEAPDPVALPDALRAGSDLDFLRTELSSLRGLLETQLSGLVWKDASRRSPIRAQVLRNLARLGIGADVAMSVVGRLEPIQEIKHIWRTPLAELSRMIPVTQSRLLDEGGIAALVGPTGVGKTTTIAKLAARYAMRNGADDVALVCADAYRIGAKEHLTAFANIIGVKVYSVSSPDELAAALGKLRSRKLVLVDTEGVSQRDAGLSERLAALAKVGMPVDFYLTLSATSQECGLDETIRCFESLPLRGAIVTKIDEAGQLGCVIGTLIRRNLAAAWFSDGQRIPDDLHAADRKKLWLVNQAVECMETSEPRIDERYMAENYSKASAAHA